MAKVMNLKYRGQCRGCGTSIPAGTRARWNGRGRGVTCLSCYNGSAPRAVYASRPQVTYWTTASGSYSTCNCIDRPCCGH